MLIRRSVEAEQLESAPCESRKEIYVEKAVKYVKGLLYYNCVQSGER